MAPRLEAVCNNELSCSGFRNERRFSFIVRNRSDIVSTVKIATQKEIAANDRKSRIESGGERKKRKSSVPLRATGGAQQWAVSLVSCRPPNAPEKRFRRVTQTTISSLARGNNLEENSITHTIITRSVYLRFFHLANFSISHSCEMDRSD